MSLGDARVGDDGRRLYIPTGTGDAELVYTLEDGRLVLWHTGVPVEQRRQGTGGQLVAAAARRAAGEGLVLVPLCSFARQWLRAHPEQAAGLAIDWSGD